jgi:drug/metabolite transporter (DMT)-like permease
MESISISAKRTSFLNAGVSQMFLSTLLFASANVFVKKVSHLPTMEIVFLRCLLGSTFCFVGLRHVKADPRGTNHKLLLLRGMFGTSALYLFFLTLQNIPLASAMTIQYLSPIFTAIIAIFVLKESVKSLQWLFYAIAFGGILFIERFDSRVSLFFLFVGVLSALCSGAAYNLVRTLRGREHPLVVVFHFQVVGLIAGLVLSLFNWETPHGADWFYLFLIGVLSQFGQMFLTAAFQKERAASVSIVIYSGLIYGLLIGWFVFGEAQTVESIAGMVLVVIGVGLSIIYNRKRIQIHESLG